MTTTLNGNESTDSISPSASYPDFSVFLAAHKLLELSGRGSLPNGIARITHNRITGRKDNQTSNSSSSQEKLKGPDTSLQGNECSPLDEKPAEEANCSGNHSDREMLTETSMEVEKEGNQNGDSLGCNEVVSEPEPQVETEPKADESQDDDGEGGARTESCVVEEASPGGSGHQSCEESMELESGDGADATENRALFSPGFGEALMCYSSSKLVYVHYIFSPQVYYLDRTSRFSALYIHVHTLYIY